MGDTLPTDHLPELLGLLAVLLLLSAFFSGSETALLGTDWLKMRYLARKGNRRARIHQGLMERRDLLLGTILVGNNLVNIAASAIATALALSAFGERGIAVATGAMTLLLLVFGEIAPKTFASQRAEPVALAVAPVFALLGRLLYPAVVAVTFLSNGLLRLFGARPEAALRPSLSEDEIRTLLTEGGAGAAVAESKRRMLHGIFQMGRQTVREVMVPRTRVRALDVATTVPEAAENFVTSGYTRLPVYRESLDEIVGIAHARDALALLGRGTAGTLAAIAREPLFVPESKDLESMLYEFQTRRTHMAVVVDEYGGVEGIVTLEDVLEEIVGEIRDEHDVEADSIRFLPGGEVLVHGGVSLRELNQRLKLRLPTDTDVTLGGFVMTRLGHIPEVGECVRHGSSELRVERTGRHRVLLVRVTPLPLPVSGRANTPGGDVPPKGG
ncbi:MAG: CNNM domain-containing protein [Deferrisomatales bacterium]|nr:CNNM domain-containing protein [Deferrisomatales bacterium]